MKKLVLTCVAGLLAATMLAGCSDNQTISNDVITITQYKGLEIEAVEAAEVTDEDVEESIRSTLEMMATSNEITDRAAQEGDVVTIDFVGKMDGVAFDGGSADDQTLELGAGQYIDGFEEGIVGHSKGEVFDIDVTFPEDYGAEDLAGKPAVFTITLDKIEEKIVPELTDELVVEKLSTTARTVEEYRAEEKENLILSNQQSADSQLSQNMWVKLLENCEVKEFPEDDMENILSEIETQYSSVAQMYSMDVDTFIQQYYGITQQEMAENLLTQQYAIELIAETENITMTAEEYEQELEAYAETWGYVAEELEEYVGHDALEEMFIQEKVGAWLVENCKQVTK